MSEEHAIAECCNKYDSKPVCDTLDFRYLLPFNPLKGDNKQRTPVEVVLHFRLERCSGDLVEGDPVYSTTLLPGEKARMFTSDRHSRWSYDSESKTAYHHETTSEESFLSAGIARAMSDLTINSSGEGESDYSESWASGGGGASLNLGIIKIGGGGGGGVYNAESTYEFSRSLSQHAESASAYVAAGVRAKSSTAVGEVAQQSHAEGESATQLDVSVRQFENRNQCHAVTYMFHKLNKVQTISFKLVAIERRLDDPFAPTGAFQKEPVDIVGSVSVLPQTVRANSSKRLEVEQMARTSAIERRQAAFSPIKSTTVSPMHTLSAIAAPISSSLRAEALEAADKDLIAVGLLDKKTLQPTKKVIAELSWSRTELIPTPGIIVRTCLDECESCEPERLKQIQLDLQRQELENKLLERNIELMDKAQEYRCCGHVDDISDGCGDNEGDEWDPVG